MRTFGGGVRQHGTGKQTPKNPAPARPLMIFWALGKGSVSRPWFVLVQQKCLLDVTHSVDGS